MLCCEWEEINTSERKEKFYPKVCAQFDRLLTLCISRDQEIRIQLAYTKRIYTFNTGVLFILHGRWCLAYYFVCAYIDSSIRRRKIQYYRLDVVQFAACWLTLALFMLDLSDSLVHFHYHDGTSFV